MSLVTTGTWLENFEEIIQEVRNRNHSSKFSSIFDGLATLNQEAMDKVLGALNASPLVCFVKSPASNHVALSVDVDQEDFHILPWLYVRVGDQTFSLIQDIPMTMLPKLKRMRFFFDNHYRFFRPPMNKEVIQEKVRKLEVVRRDNDYLFYPTERPGLLIKTSQRDYEVVLGNETPDLSPVDVPIGDMHFILSHFQIPEWTDLRPTELSVYAEGYNQVEESHIEFIKVVVASIPKDFHIIAPGDGTGLVYRVCVNSGRTCTSGDPIRRTNTNCHVGLEVGEETVIRGIKESEGKRMCCILSYVSCFLKEIPPLPSIWIDTPQVMYRFPVRPISRNVYISGIWETEPVIPSVRSDVFRRAYRYVRPPYYLNLMELRHVTFNSITPSLTFLLKSHALEVYSENDNVKKYVKQFGRSVALTSGLLVLDKVDYWGDIPFYFVPIGRVVFPSEVRSWDGVSKIQRRTLYEIDDRVVLPRGMFSFLCGIRRFCYVPDMMASVLYRRMELDGNFFGNVTIATKLPVDHRKDHRRYMYDELPPSDVLFELFIDEEV